jgi:multidrug efflux pump subunit AcrB
MWIVRFALQRPYTFVIVALLIAIFGIASILQTPTDILPDIDIPIVSVIWTYSGMDADDMSKRIVAVCERALPTTVNNIQYTESQSYNGVGVIKIHFQPGVQVDLAIAQVTALAQSLLRLMPTGILPPYVLKYDASSVPIVQVSMGGKGLSQTELYDLGQNFIRGQLATIKGAAVPLPYGGEQRSIMVDLEPLQLAANHLTASDISAALNNQNLVTPSGTAKMGDREYLVGTNSSAATVAELNALPIRTFNGAVVQMKDVAWIHNGYQPQTSYVSENGQASALLTVIKSGASSTLTIVDDVKAALPRIKAGLPSALTLTPIFDQSVLVRASIQDVVQEAVTAAFLTAMMVLVFLGSWRSTLIVSVSIPLAVLFAIAVSSALGETINVMSLGGTGPGGGHAGRRCDGGDREHAPQSWSWGEEASGQGDPGQRGAGSDAGTDFDDVDLHRLRAGDAVVRFGEVHFHPAGRECSARTDRLVRAVAYVGTHHDALPSAEGGASLSGAGERVPVEPKLHLALSPEV